MLTAANPTAFLATTDPERAREFYGETLGLRLVEQTQFALLFDCRTMPLRISIVERFDPQPHTVFGWQVASIEHTVDGLGERGIETESFAGMEQDERGIWTAPGGARVAWFRDPDGSLLSITEV